MGFFSSGGSASANAGAGIDKAVGRDALGLTSKYGGLQNVYRQAGDKTADQLFTMPANGGLNPYLSQQFANEKSQIGRAYGDQLAAAQKGLTERGMSAAPSGMQASMINSNNRNVGAAETGAYQQQLQNQLGLGLQGVKYNQEQQQLYSPLGPMSVAEGAAEGLGKIAPVQQSFGSGFNNVMKGIGTAAAML